MRILTFILLFPFNSIAQDALLEVMMRSWKDPEPEPEPESQYWNTEEPEAYSWALGEPDNIPELEIIYENSNPCELTYR